MAATYDQNLAGPCAGLIPVVPLTRALDASLDA